MKNLKHKIIWKKNACLSGSILFLFHVLAETFCPYWHEMIDLSKSSYDYYLHIQTIISCQIIVTKGSSISMSSCIYFV